MVLKYSSSKVSVLELKMVIENVHREENHREDTEHRDESHREDTEHRDESHRAWRFK